MINISALAAAAAHYDAGDPRRVQHFIKVYGYCRLLRLSERLDAHTQNMLEAAALLHDITANAYHKTNVPNSSKHKFNWLTYSSLAQVCKYANRVSYQVLNQHSPRLTRGLPEREDSLEEAYWDR